MTKEMIDKCFGNLVGRCGRLASEREKVERAYERLFEDPEDDALYETVDAWLDDLDELLELCEALKEVDEAKGTELYACTADLRAFRRDTLMVEVDDAR
jgi:hypothetical protein